MSRSITSLLLSIIFMGFILAPTVIVMIDDTIDVSFFYTSAGEEEDKGLEKNKDLEVIFLELDINDADFVSNDIENNTRYVFKKYQKPHLNLISPPPRIQHIIISDLL